MTERLQKTAATDASLAAPPLIKIFVLQGLILLVGCVLLLSVNLQTAWTAFFGGLISIVPNAYFARWAFRFSGAQSAAHVTQSFYRGEAGKFVLTACLFAAVFFAVKPLVVPVLFAAYALMIIVNWLLALRYSRYR